jgi:polysaccharide biosynthesis/export protein
MLSYVMPLMSVGVLLLTACSSAPAPIAGSVDAGSVSAQMKSAGYDEFVILPGDVLSVKFFYDPTLNEEVTVRPDGRISLQLVPETIAAGKTPSQLADILSEKYQKELRKPEITVIVRSFSGHKIYVDGEVNKPGDFEVVASLTLLQAIARAGGLKDTAGNNQVLIIRKTSAPSPSIITADIGAAVTGRDLTQDIPLIPLDIVYVPRSQVANVNLWVDQYIRKNIPFYPSLGIFYQPVQPGH